MTILSNGVTTYVNGHSWRNWIACQPPTLKVVGSIPAGCTKKRSGSYHFFFCKFVLGRISVRPPQAAHPALITGKTLSGTNMKCEVEA